MAKLTEAEKKQISFTLFLLRLTMMWEYDKMVMVIKYYEKRGDRFMTNDYYHSQQFIDDIHKGSEKLVAEALEHNGALYRVNGITSAVNHKIVSPIIVDKIIKLKDDNVVTICGAYVSEYAIAALDILGIEKYTGNEFRILRLIESGFNFW